MSDEQDWRRMIAPQDALLWWLTPQVGYAAHHSAEKALRWAHEAHLSPAGFLEVWLHRTEAAPGVNPLAVAGYLAAVPFLLGLLRRPPTPERVQEVLEHARIDALPPGLPPAVQEALAQAMRAESALAPAAEAVPPLPAGTTTEPERPLWPAEPTEPPQPPTAHGGGSGTPPPPWRGVRLTPDTRRAIQWAHGSAAVNVTHWADTVRADLRWQVMVGLKAGRTYRQQATVLRDRYTQWGADFECVAVTEAHAAMMAGRLLGYPDGATVRAILAPGACPDCKRLLDGKTFTVRHEPGDPWAEVWPGKTNAGLPRAQWRPCFGVHPRCRCVAVVAGVVGAQAQRN